MVKLNTCSIHKVEKGKRMVIMDYVIYSRGKRIAIMDYVIYSRLMKVSGDSCHFYLTKLVLFITILACKEWREVVSI